MIKFKKIMASTLASVCIVTNAVGFTANAAYNSSNAVAYALKWAGEKSTGDAYYNPNFVSQDQDCTNFVSQCMFAGGVSGCISAASYALAYIKNGCSSGRKDEWYYIENKWGTGSWSSTWTLVDSNGSKDGLRQYLSRSGKTTSKKTNVTLDNNTYKNVKAGDIIQISYDGGSTYGHSVIVSSVYNGQIYFCAHTNNRKNANLKTTLSKYSNIKLNIFRPKA